MDVFAAFPFGTDPRGRGIGALMFEVNWLIGARPGQGKTAAVRVLAWAAALDPLANCGFTSSPARATLTRSRRSATGMSGLDDESIAYAAESLRMLRAELDKRSPKLKAIPKESPDGKVTRAMAGKPSRGCSRWSPRLTRCRTCS